MSKNTERTLKYYRERIKISVCAVCGKEIEQKKRGAKRRFCSDSCKAIETAIISKARNYKKAYLNACEFCKKEFNPYRKTQKFCSVHCATRGRAGPTKRSSSQQHNTQCQECGKLIYRRPSLLNKTKYHYCSKACLQLSQEVLFLGKNNPNYKAAGKRRCIACGKGYISYNNTRKFCSQKCSAAAQQSEVMANLKRGHNAELRCGKELKRKGYHVTLSAASRGEYDVIAMNKDEILLIQVKYTKSKGGATPRARRRLKAAIAPTHRIVKKQLWTWVDRKGWIIE